MAQHLGIRIHLHNDRHTEFILVRSQTTELVAQSFGEHRNDFVHQINARTTAVCLFVEGSLLVDVVGDIGDMDAYLVVARIEDLEGERIVEILGLIRVDSEGQDVAHIPTAEQFLRRDRSNG